MKQITDQRKGWMRRRVEAALFHGLRRTYGKVQVDPQRYLVQLRTSYGLPVSSYQGIFTLPIHHVDAVARDVIRSSMRIAAAEGAGLGMGGLFTVVPDLGILSAITMRTIQKLSLVYGFEFSSEPEMAELWMAAASAAGVDIGRDLIEKNLLKRFVARAIRVIAAQASKEIVEKWAVRMVPVVSAIVGGGLNYYFVRTWGERAMRHFHERHLAKRAELQEPHPAGQPLARESLRPRRATLYTVPRCPTSAAVGRCGIGAASSAAALPTPRRGPSSRPGTSR